MSASKKTVSAIEVGLGALNLIPDLPSMGKTLLKTAFLSRDSERSLGLIFQNVADAAPHSLFLRTENRDWTYAQANAKVNQMARALLAMNVRQNDSVALMSENSAELLLGVLATVKIGAVAALINNNQQGHVLAHSLGLVKPKVILLGESCEPALAELVTQAAPCLQGAQVLSLDRAQCAELWITPFGKLVDQQGDANLSQTSRIRADSSAFYIFTSGTTGLPKASIMSHYRWLLAMSGMGMAVRLQQDDVFYCCLPLYHNNALTVSLGIVLSAGACFALDRKFSASRFWDQIRKFEATAFCYIGELLRYLLNRPASMNDCNHMVRLIVGNGLRPEVWSAFEDRFGISNIFEFYGASESNIGFINVFGLKETVGFSPIPYKIIACDPATEQPARNKKGFAHEVERGEVGLLVSEINDLNPFDGYTDAAANEKKILRNLFKKGDCWFNSGDLVRRQGWFHIQFVDRLGDTFRWKGENVATSEVEGAISQVPWIEHGAVYGVLVDGADGRAGMAAITLKEGAEFDGQDLAAILTGILPKYAVPLFVRVTNQTQTTGTFKYQKVQLKNEGYDPEKVSDPLYRLNEQANPPVYELF